MNSNLSKARWSVTSGDTYSTYLSSDYSEFKLGVVNSNTNSNDQVNYVWQFEINSLGVSHCSPFSDFTDFKFTGQHDIAYEYFLVVAS